VQKGEELLEKYGSQLDYYETALRRLTGKRVKEKLIYSFCLKETIEVDVK
jgi:ATP-dependent helicase/nuclease subunit A